MPVYRLNDALVFPDPARADPSGLLAVGGDVRPERVLLGYRQGIFPWYSEGEPIWWHSPDPRFVLEPGRLHLPRSLQKVLRRGDFTVRLDSQFAKVIRNCAKRRRPRQRGTWITPDMIRTYDALHADGWAHSAEAYAGESLVGGLYGVSIGDVFFGESMYAYAEDASKFAFAVLVRWLGRQGIQLVDSQVRTEHVARFGGEDWPRVRYLERLAEWVDRPTRRGPWRLSPEECRELASRD